MNYQKEKLGNVNPIYHSKKKNKVPRNKFNQGGKAYLENYRTLKKEAEEATNKWKLYHVYGLKELTSLKYPYYPKQSMDSMQFLSRFQWHISQI